MTVTVETGEEVLRGRTRLIVGPDRAWIPTELEQGGKAAGVAVSLYGLRSSRNWGCGDFTDLEPVIDWVAQDLGGGFLSLNPLHAIANRQPFNTSPYLPASIFFRNPIYIDVERVEEFAGAGRARALLESPEVQAEIRSLRESPYVEYERVYDLKLRFLALAFAGLQESSSSGSPRGAAFEEYCRREGDFLERFATYCALDEWIHANHPDVWTWPEWPEEYRDPETPAVRMFRETYRERILFHKYLQWLTETQLEEAQRYAKRKGLSIGIYHDLALATDRCGSDLWAHRVFYASGCRVGSPPDDFSPNGQDWGFPPPNEERRREDGHRFFAESIRRNCRHGGALRIDHVMRLFRLFWIPDGMGAVDGSYVREDQEDLLRIVALESVRQQVLIVGEDLGTVEPSFREALARFGILSYRLFYFERNDQGDFRSPLEYPRQALVSVTTHDLPTLAGYWLNRDIEARRQAGLLGGEDAYRAQLSARAADKQEILDALHRLALLPEWFPKNASEVPELTGELHNAITGFLASTPSMLMVLNQEDLVKETEQQNLPGSTWQYPNWRRKTRFTVEELRSSGQAKDCTAMFRHWLEKTGRS
jgi:4-alpha-glucanotransferase